MGFRDTIAFYLDPYKNSFAAFVYAFILIVILCLIVYYVYTTDFKQYYNNPGTSDIPNAATNKGDTVIMLFYVDWCPHCTTAKPLWENVKSKYNNTYVNGYKCKFMDYNAEDEKNKELVSEYDIKGYPTIKMRKGNDVIDFDAKITATSLEEFLQNMTSD